MITFVGLPTLLWAYSTESEFSKLFNIIATNKWCDDDGITANKARQPTGGDDDLLYNAECDALQCGDKCARNPECQIITIFGNSGWCHLRKNCDPVRSIHETTHIYQRKSIESDDITGSNQTATDNPSTTPPSESNDDSDASGIEPENTGGTPATDNPSTTPPSESNDDSDASDSGSDDITGSNQANYNPSPGPSKGPNDYVAGSNTAPPSESYDDDSDASGTNWPLVIAVCVIGTFALVVLCYAIYSYCSAAKRQEKLKPKAAETPVEKDATFYNLKRAPNEDLTLKKKQGTKEAKRRADAKGNEAKQVSKNGKSFPTSKVPNKAATKHKVDLKLPVSYPVE